MVFNQSDLRRLQKARECPNGGLAALIDADVASLVMRRQKTLCREWGGGQGQQPARRRSPGRAPAPQGAQPAYPHLSKRTLHFMRRLAAEGFFFLLLLLSCASLSTQQTERRE